MKKFLPLIIILAALITGFFGRTTISAMAEEPSQIQMTPYYSSVMIEEGESLWGIAQRYYPNSPMTVDEYIQEIRNMNCLKDDTIHAGKYLTIVYFK